MPDRLKRWWYRRRYEREMRFQERVMGRPGTRPDPYAVCSCGHERRIHEPACRGYTITPTGERWACPCGGYFRAVRADREATR